jgi:hypothetical protein
VESLAGIKPGPQRKGRSTRGGLSRIIRVTALARAGAPTWSEGFAMRSKKIGQEEGQEEKKKK